MHASKLFLIRHGETLWNLEGRIQGHLDSPLTALGIAQTKALATRLKKYTFAAIYSSDLPRTRQTVQWFSNDQPVIFKACLRERNLGIFQGSLRKDLEILFPAESSHYQDPDYVIPNGESAHQFRERCVNCLEEIAKQHRGESILVVTHGGVLSNIFKHTLHLPFDSPRHYALLNTTLNIFSCQDNHWRLETWGDLGHLEIKSESPMNADFADDGSDIARTYDD